MNDIKKEVSQVKKEVKDEVKQNVQKEVKKAVKQEVKKVSKENTDKHPVFLAKTSFGQRAADKLAKWAGSWGFILLFAIVLVVWMLINGWIMIKYFKTDSFDPYPFILLNLVLSCLAAIQAPIILMSQNRQTQMDRIRSEYDYSVNRRAEREIRAVHEDLLKIKNIISRKRKR